MRKNWRLLALVAAAAVTAATQVGTAPVAAAPPAGGGFSGVAGDFNGDGKQDLATATKACILAYWHHPLFNAGSTTMLAGPRAFWDDLYPAGADIVLNGHLHNYQRFGKQDPAGQAASNGVREFIVGTGGRSNGGSLSPSYPNFEFGNTASFGVLKLHLGANSYSWEYVTINGTVLDSGGPVSCN